MSVLANYIIAKALQRVSAHMQFSNVDTRHYAETYMMIQGWADSFRPIYRTAGAIESGAKRASAGFPAVV
jgi:hypothetical protein